MLERSATKILPDWSTEIAYGELNSPLLVPALPKAVLNP